MKKYFKYKLYKYINRNLKQAPKKDHLLKFKKAKWFIIKKIWQKNIYFRPKWVSPKKTAKSFRENIKIINPKYKLKRRKNTFRNLLQTKRLLYAVFNKALKIKFWQQLQQQKWKRLDYVTTFLIKPYFKVDILLWSLDFFISTRDAKKAILNKKIYLNNKLLKSNSFLKKGDVILLKKLPNIKTKQNKFTNDKKIMSFLEIDYYTNTVIITKDYKSLTNADIHLIVKNTFSVTRWRYKI